MPCQNHRCKNISLSAVAKFLNYTVYTLLLTETVINFCMDAYDRWRRARPSRATTMRQLPGCSHSHVWSYLYDGVVYVHVVLLADSGRGNFAQQHLHRDQELEDAHLLPNRIFVTVIACIRQRLHCCRLHIDKQTYGSTHACDYGCRYMSVPPLLMTAQHYKLISNHETTACLVKQVDKRSLMMNISIHASALLMLQTACKQASTWLAVYARMDRGIGIQNFCSNISSHAYNTPSLTACRSINSRLRNAAAAWLLHLYNELLHTAIVNVQDKSLAVGTGSQMQLSATTANVTVGGTQHTHNIQCTYMVLYVDKLSMCCLNSLDMQLQQGCSQHAKGIH